MNALRIIADDLTGACDIGAEMLPWPAGVVVQPAAGGSSPAGALGVRNTQSRTLSPAEAASRVSGVLDDLRIGWSGIVLKIDLATQTLTLAGGRTIEFPIDPFAKQFLLEGVDELGYMLKQEPAIAAYESKRVDSVNTLA